MTQPPVSPFAMSRDVLGWETADRLVHELRHYDEGRSGVGSRPTPARVICSTVMLMRQLSESGVSPPDRVYALPDGNIMLEWRLDGGGMMRLEVEAEGRGQIMITRPGTRAAFIDFQSLQILDFHQAISFHSKSMNVARVPGRVIMIWPRPSSSTSTRVIPPPPRHHSSMMFPSGKA